MALEDMQQIQVEQLQHAEVPKDLGNKMWAQVGQGIDNMMNMIIESAGNLLGAVVTKGPGMLMDAAASVGGAVSTAATAPFKDFVPSGSPGRENASVRAPDVPQKEREIGRDQYGGEIGNLQPTQVAAARVQNQSQGMSM